MQIRFRGDGLPHIVMGLNDSPLTVVKGGPLKIFDFQGGGLRKNHPCPYRSPRDGFAVSDPLNFLLRKRIKGVKLKFS